MTSKQTVFAFVVALMVTYSVGEDLSVNDFCRLRTGVFAHPNPLLCYRWIQCFFFGGILNKCEPGTIFDLSEGCVPGDRTNCHAEVPMPTVPTFPTDPTTEHPGTENICDGIVIGFLPDPNRCDGFILCVFEEPEFIMCPNPEQPVFDTRVNACVEGDVITCKPGPNQPTTVTPPQTTTTTTISTVPSTPPAISPTPPTTATPPTPSSTTVSGPTNPPSPPPQGICNGNSYRFVAHPTSCYKYYFCLRSIPVPGECDWDRIFVQRLQGCVLGNQQTCERNSNIISVTINPTRPN